jgi:hypothetical protein
MKTKPIAFNYELCGIEATYHRLNDDKSKSIPLVVYPFTANIETVESSGGAARWKHSRIENLWVDLSDLQFILRIGEKPNSVEGDEIVLRVDGKDRCYKVTSYLQQGKDAILVIEAIKTKEVKGGLEA